MRPAGRLAVLSAALCCGLLGVGVLPAAALGPDGQPAPPATSDPAITDPAAPAPPPPPAPLPVADPVVTVNGRGYGHGVGLAQDGALFMGRRGATLDQILQQFYPGTAYGKAAGPSASRSGRVTPPRGSASRCPPAGPSPVPHRATSR